MFINLLQFQEQLAQSVFDVEDDIVKLQTTISIEAMKRIVEKTPVDTGVTRGNWKLEIGIRPRGWSKVRKDKEGGSTLNTAITKLLGNLRPYEVVYIANSVPWIEILEYGQYPDPPKNPGVNAKGEVKTVEGFSRQSPQGMVRVTMVELEGIFR